MAMPMKELVRRIFDEVKNDMFGAALLKNNPQLAHGEWPLLPEWEAKVLDAALVTNYIGAMKGLLEERVSHIFHPESRYRNFVACAVIQKNAKALSLLLLFGAVIPENWLGHYLPYSIYPGQKLKGENPLSHALHHKDVNTAQVLFTMEWNIRTALMA